MLRAHRTDPRIRDAGSASPVRLFQGNKRVAYTSQDLLWQQVEPDATTRKSSRAKGRAFSGGSARWHCSAQEC